MNKRRDGAADPTVRKQILDGYYFSKEVTTYIPLLKLLNGKHNGRTLWSARPSDDKRQEACGF